MLRQVLTTSLSDAAPTPGALASTTSTTSAQPAPPTPPAQPEAAVPNEVASAAVEVSSLPVTITAGPVTPTTVAPALAPQLAPETVEPELLLQGTASPLSQGASEFGVANAVMSSPATAAAAVARAAVSGAALNQLQEAVQAGPSSSVNSSSLGLDEGQSLSWLPAVTGARLANIEDGALPAPTCRRRRSAGHCRRRSRCCRRRWYRTLRPKPPCSICSRTPMARSRGRRCCRSLRCPIRSTPRSDGSTRRHRAGILKFRL